MNKAMIAASVLAILAPAGAMAQTAAPVTPPPAPLAAPAAPGPVDPARLAAARPVIDRIWPLGTYARLMNGVMDQLMDSTMSGMYDMKLEDFAKIGGADDTSTKEVKDALGGKTMGEIMASYDPAYKERQKITMNVMMGEMTRIMTEVEPDIREAMAHAYARRFTTDQLTELARFFSTPTGTAYASDSMMLMMGPDMMQTMQSFLPRMMKQMPAIMAKVEEATKGLPPIKMPPHPTPKKRPQ